MIETSKVISYTKNGVIIEFFLKDPTDTKFSFRVKGDEDMTEKLLSSRKGKKRRISERSIKHVVESLFRAIVNGFPDPSVNTVQTGIDDISRFVQKYQKRFGRSPKFEDTREGVESASLFGVKITTPENEIWYGIGKSKKAARLALAKEFLKEKPVPASVSA
jgi:hypothetical protein